MLCNPLNFTPTEQNGVVATQVYSLQSAQERIKNCTIGSALTQYRRSFIEHYVLVLFMKVAYFRNNIKYHEGYQICTNRDADFSEQGQCTGKHSLMALEKCSTTMPMIYIDKLKLVFVIPNAAGFTISLPLNQSETSNRLGWTENICITIVRVGRVQNCYTINGIK